jgi:hypothetical protein
VTERRDYRVESRGDGQWYVFLGLDHRVAGPFPQREEALADARDRALHAGGPATVEGEDVIVQEQYGGAPGPTGER